MKRINFTSRSSNNCKLHSIESSLLLRLKKKLRTQLIETKWKLDLMIKFDECFALLLEKLNKIDYHLVRVRI
jgi:hypothetical protein